MGPPWMLRSSWWYSASKPDCWYRVLICSACANVCWGLLLGLKSHWIWCPSQSLCQAWMFAQSAASPRCCTSRAYFIQEWVCQSSLFPESAWFAVQLQKITQNQSLHQSVSWYHCLQGFLLSSLFLVLPLYLVCLIMKNIQTIGTTAGNWQYWFTNDLSTFLIRTFRLTSKLNQNHFIRWKLNMDLHLSGSPGFLY